MEPNRPISHDAIDAFVASILGWCDQRFGQKPAQRSEVAFSDEWERKEIARELHWN